ncbi:MAG: polysulfide reductase [Candidatus Neomarinimicrobiota bacterium]|nr:MAG: polysulfide reductase [Candidatus Neomarinimicrobiota bacterium]
MMEDLRKDPDYTLFRPILESDRRFYWAVAFLGAVVLWALALYIRQLIYGLGVTGLNRTVTWGFYIINFVFFIGVSHAGTLISAILRLSQAEWRRPITRMAEVITAIVLAIGGLHPIIDLGRPDRVLNVFYYGRLQSPLLWDVTAISLYFTASTVYLYVPMIPDIALLRDRTTKFKKFYTWLSWGYVGTERQKHILERAMTILMVVVIPVAVSVHTVISYIFSMTLQSGWHSTIFGPYFVTGAIFSGTATLLVVMIFFRKFYHLENYLKEIHFRYLSVLLLVFALLWGYFTFSEYLTGIYGNEPMEMRVIRFKISGAYAPYFWMMVICNFVIPVIILSFKKLKRIPGILIASISVIIGMWLERLIIIVPSLSNPRLPVVSEPYVPSLTEWSLFAGGVAAFCLMFLLFSKLFPLISIWEIKEGRAEGLEAVHQRLESYLPDTPAVQEGV